MSKLDAPRPSEKPEEKLLSEILQEISDENMREVAAKTVRCACDLVRKRYEKSPESEQLDYHNVDHTVGVIRRTVSILKALGVDDKVMLNGITSASFHDTKQDIHLQEMKETFGDQEIIRVIRTRPNKGKSERDSIAEAQVFMKTINEAVRDVLKRDVFTEEDEAVVDKSIDATIPAFSPKVEDDPKTGTVYQEGLKADSPLEAYALALSDIGVPGMEPPAAYLRDGDAVFREQEASIAADMLHIDKLDEVCKQFYREKMLSWEENQISFAKGRQARLDDELAGLREKHARTEEQLEAVRELFGYFDENIAYAERTLQKRKEMSFEELAEDMGFKVSRVPE